MLLGLSPDVGPRDGGTRVRLQGLGINASTTVLLQPVHPQLSVILNTSRLVATEQTDDGVSFITPDVTADGSDVTGLLVSLSFMSQLSELENDGNIAQTKSLLFGLTGELNKLMPTNTHPCCQFKISGGEELLLSWATSALATPPSAHPVVRFRGRWHQHQVTGIIKSMSSHSVSGGADTDTNEWQVRALAPPWPKAEGHISLEVSWNRQQFSRFARPIRFVEENSFFGDVAGGISEENLPKGKKDAAVSSADPSESSSPASGASQELVTILDDHTGPAPAPGKGPDLSHVMLMDEHGDAFILARARDLSHLREDPRLIHDLFVLTCAATAGGAIISRIGTADVIGFLLGGALVGPGGCDAVVELVQVESVAELGVCLLLFCLGLEFSFGELLKNMSAAIAGILAMIGLCSCITFFAVFFSQTPVHEALCIGIFASLSSTPVSLRSVPQGKLASTTASGEISVLLAVLVAQDMALACILATLPYIFTAAGPTAPAVNATTPAPVHHLEAPRSVDMLDHTTWFQPQLYMMVASLQAAAFILVLLGRKRLARSSQVALAWTSAQLLTLNDELFSLLALSYVFVLAYATDRLGLSLETGAFAAGLTLKSFSSDVAERADKRLGSLKDVFAALFFGSIGLVVSGRFLFDNLGAISSVVGFIFAMKTATAFLPLRMLATRKSPTPALTALRVSCIVAHVGEFGFVVAAKGSIWGVLPRHVYLLLIGANSISLCLAPWLVQLMEVVLPEDAETGGCWPAPRHRIIRVKEPPFVV